MSLEFNDSLERLWATQPLSPVLPRAESLPPSSRCPSRLEPRQVPRTHSPATWECLIHLCIDEPVQRGKPVPVLVKLSKSVVSELRRPTGFSRGPKYDKKAAYLVAMDAEVLRLHGQGIGLRASQAARRRLLAQGALCAPRVRLSEGCQSVQLHLAPTALPGRESLVLLQVVVEAAIDHAHWVHFGRLVPVRVAAPEPAAEGDRTAEVQEACAAEPAAESGQTAEVQETGVAEPAAEGSQTAPAELVGEGGQTAEVQEALAAEAEGGLAAAACIDRQAFARAFGRAAAGLEVEAADSPDLPS